MTIDEVVRIAKDYDHVVLHTSTPSFRADVRTAQALKASKPDTVIGFVGGHVTSRPEESLRYGGVIDYVARKSSTWRSWHRRGPKYRDVAGISYLENGIYQHNDEPEPLTTEQLDALPFSSDVYARTSTTRSTTALLPVPLRVALHGPRVPGALHVLPLAAGDDRPQLPHPQRRERARGVQEPQAALPRHEGALLRRRHVHGRSEARRRDREGPRQARHHVVDELARERRPRDAEGAQGRRARLFVVGYESGNEQILKNIKKGVSVERARRFTKDCHDIGILIHGTFIVGLPGETRDTIEETIRFAKEMQPETLQCSLASPYPGTAMYDWVREHKYLTVDSLVDETGYQKCTVSYPEVVGRRDLRGRRARLSRVLLQPPLHLEVREEDGPRPEGGRAHARRGARSSSSP
jgi:hypothetical protein